MPELKRGDVGGNAIPSCSVVCTICTPANSLVPGLTLIRLSTATHLCLLLQEHLIHNGHYPILKLGVVGVGY